jgi:hypothetical protein
MSSPDENFGEEEGETSSRDEETTEPSKDLIQSQDDASELEEVNENENLEIQQLFMAEPRRGSSNSGSSR